MTKWLNFFSYNAKECSLLLKRRLFEKMGIFVVRTLRSENNKFNNILHYKIMVKRGKTIGVKISTINFCAPMGTGTFRESFLEKLQHSSQHFIPCELKKFSWSNFWLCTINFKFWNFLKCPSSIIEIPA